MQLPTKPKETLAKSLALKRRILLGFLLLSYISQQDNVINIFLNRLFKTTFMV